MCVFRFKIWWRTQRMGTSGNDIPFETQFLIVEANEGDGVGESAVYTVFLPIIEGDFRAVLQGNSDNELEICLESGDPAVEGFVGSHLVFVAARSDPFDVITNAVKSVERHLQTFCHRERKKILKSRLAQGKRRLAEETKDKQIFGPVPMIDTVGKSHILRENSSGSWSCEEQKGWRERRDDFEKKCYKKC